ncbi:hypothetical protein O6H91_04G022700 [Diphasiastrum complanatum]|uniref:Uncharacterized protein n=1 Tax=Diphasiastrum complanatum TaxID=34168 RepID=A0ACC2DUV6_DIPCM|nr:hypothetical protein O6H91_Y147700 [Diphasiastrum complanatum]KAJ7558033.1 hypothetical protein O6H91_04G022700 [Diphasiastrum complanatum]
MPLGKGTAATREGGSKIAAKELTSTTEVVADVVATGVAVARGTSALEKVEVAAARGGGRSIDRTSARVEEVSVRDEGARALMMVDSLSTRGQGSAARGHGSATGV